MKKPQGPCKGCTFETGRSIEPNCHDSCEKYKKYKQELEAWEAHRKKDQRIESAMNELNSQRRERFSRKR